MSDGMGVVGARRACDAGGQTRLSGAHGHRAARVSIIF